MKTARVIIGAIIAIIGVMVLVGTKNDSNYELLSRGLGFVLFVVGALIAKAFDFQKS